MEISQMMHTERARQIIEALKIGALSVAELATLTGLENQPISNTLNRLQRKGLVIKSGNNKWQLITKPSSSNNNPVERLKELAPTSNDVASAILHLCREFNDISCKCGQFIGEIEALTERNKILEAENKELHKARQSIFVGQYEDENLMHSSEAKG